MDYCAELWEKAPFLQADHLQNDLLVHTRALDPILHFE